jgi:hypothetical protein
MHFGVLRGSGVCQDGGAGSTHAWPWPACEYGTDCDDCGPRPMLPPAPLPPPPASPPPPPRPPQPPQPPTGPDGSRCSNTCGWSGGEGHGADDGACDDGGRGAEYHACEYGTDCADCGARAVRTPWWEQAGQRWNGAMARDKAETAEALGRLERFVDRLAHSVGLFGLLLAAAWILHGLHFVWANCDAYTAQPPPAAARSRGGEEEAVTVTPDDFCEYIGPNPYHRHGPPVYTGRRPYNLVPTLSQGMPPQLDPATIRAKEAQVLALRARAAELGVPVPSREAMHRVIQTHLQTVGSPDRRPPHELARALLNLDAAPGHGDTHLPKRETDGPRRDPHVLDLDPGLLHRERGALDRQRGVLNREHGVLNPDPGAAPVSHVHEQRPRAAPSVAWGLTGTDGCAHAQEGRPVLGARWPPGAVVQGHPVPVPPPPFVPLQTATPLAPPPFVPLQAAALAPHPGVPWQATAPAASRASVSLRTPAAPHYVPPGAPPPAPPGTPGAAGGWLPPPSPGPPAGHTCCNPLVNPYTHSPYSPLLMGEFTPDVAWPAQSHHRRGLSGNAVAAGQAGACVAAGSGGTNAVPAGLSGAATAAGASRGAVASQDEGGGRQQGREGAGQGQADGEGLTAGEVDAGDSGGGGALNLLSCGAAGGESAMQHAPGMATPLAGGRGRERRVRWAPQAQGPYML